MEAESSSDESNQSALNKEEEEIQQNLKNIPYQVLLKMRNKIEKSENDYLSNDQGKKNYLSKSEANEVRKHKRAPLQRSSRVPVSRFQTVIESKKIKGRDPRFDELSATALHTTEFNKAYNFLQDKANAELNLLEKELKKKKKHLADTDREILVQHYSQLKDQIKRKEALNTEFNAEKEVKQELKEKSLSTGKPQFLSKKILKEKILQKKFDDLEKSGKLGSFVRQKKKQSYFKERRQLKNLEKNSNFRSKNNQA